MAPDGEDRAGQAPGQQPYACRAREEVAEGRAGGAERAGEREGRVVERARRADVGVGGNEVLLGLHDIRAALQQRGGEVGGDQGRNELVDGFPARDRRRVASEQDGNQVLLRCDRLLERRNCGERLLILRTNLHHFGLRHDAGLETQVEDPCGFAEVPGRRPRDLELPVERPQSDVARRDTRHYRKHDAALRLFARIDLRLRGFAQAAHATEKVELPGGAERCLVQRELVVHAGRDGRLPHPRRLGAARIGAVAQLRQRLGPRADERADELIHSGGGDAYVAILAQRGLDQPVQHRVAELFPPLRIRDFGGLGIVDPPRGRRVHAGPHVIRSDRAAGERRGNEHCEGMLLQLCLHAVTGAEPKASRLRTGKMAS